MKTPPPRKMTSVEDLVLSNAELIADIIRPSVPKVGEAKNLQVVQPYNVFLPKLTNEAKRKKAIPLIEEFSGLTTEEATKLASRAVIAIAKGVDEERAADIKDRFMEIGILPRIRLQI